MVGLTAPGTQAPRAPAGGPTGPAGSVVDLVFAGVLAAVGGSGFLSAFRLEDLTKPVVAAAATGAAVSLLVTGLLRRRLGFSAAVAVWVLGAVAVVVCGGGAGTLRSGFLDGFQTLTDLAVPVPVSPEVLFVPFAVTGIAAFLGGELAQRTRSPVAPVLPSLGALVLGLAFGMVGHLPPAWIPIAWVALALLTTCWRTNQAQADATVATVVVAGQDGQDSRRNGGAHTSADDRARRNRRGAANAVRALLVVAVVAAPILAVARWAGPRLPGAQEEADRRYFPRDEQPLPEAHTSPLAQLTGLQAGADDPLFEAETSAAVERWRLAVLDDYDGVSWTSPGPSYLPAGVELPGPPDGPGADAAAAGETTRVTQTIETVALEGPWLPVADRAVEVDTSGLLFDPGSGVLIAGERMPARYQVVSEVPERDAAELGAATAANDDEAAAARELPEGVPDVVAQEIRPLADEITAGALTDYDRAVAIEQHLAGGTGPEPYQLATENPGSGQTWANLHCLLLGENCAHTGSTEQFVAAYAVLARMVDLPARIVVGFDGAGSPGRDPVTAHEATAWVEVKFEGVGWLAFDPVPDPNVQTTPPTTALPGSSGGTPDSQPATTVPQASDSPSPDDQGDDAGAGDESSSRTTTMSFAGAAVLLLGLVLLPGLLRARRRRRRRNAPSPAARVAGAWAVVVDELRRGGVPLTRGQAVGDIVVAGHHRFATVAEPLVPLGAMVNRARFGRAEPAPAEADQAWHLTDTFTTQRRKGRPLPRRLREYFSLRT